MKHFPLLLLGAGMAYSTSFAQSNTTLIRGKVISFDASLPPEGAGIIVKGSKTATGIQAPKASISYCYARTGNRKKAAFHSN